VPELPMFPLGTVLLPHMVLPLHVFEPRYRALMHDVLAGDQEFGVVLISRGHEVGGGDERTDVGTVARVLQAEELEDGRWVTVTVGTRRVHITAWLDDDPYPRAEVEDLLTAEPAPDASRLAAVERRVRRVLGMQAELDEPTVPATVDLAEDPVAASWQLAVLAPLTPLDAQRVLTTDPADDRLALLDDLVAGLEEAYAFRLGADDR
jgi:uncharacterized protein